MQSLEQTRLERWLCKLIYALITPLGFVMVWCFLRVTVYGRHNIPARKKGYLIVSNHCLYLDPVVIGYAMFPQRLRHSTIERNLRLPVAGRLNRLLGAFAVDGHSNWQNLSQAIIEQVQRGDKVHFFPEGNLIRFNQKLQRFRHGAFQLSIQHDIPVLPVTTVVKRRRFLGKKIYWLPPKIDVHIGEMCFPLAYKNITPLYRRAYCMANAVKQEMQSVLSVNGII